MASVGLLPFQYEILQELNASDGLCVMASGIGWAKPVAAFLRAHVFAPYGGSILLLNLKSLQKKALNEELLRHDPSSAIPVEINQAVSATERLVHYSSGGCCYVTPRILAVDLLLEKIPAEAFAGIFVLNAERVSDSSGVEFAIRLFRRNNRTAFVRGICDQPSSFIGGFNQVRDRLFLLLGLWMHHWHWHGCGLILFFIL